MAITTESVQLAMADFIDNRIMPAVGDDNTALKWMIGGVSTVGLAKLKDIVNHYRPLLHALGFIDDKGNFLIQVMEQFVNSAFQKQETFSMPLLGVPFRFDRSDGQYLIEAIKRYGG